MFATNAPETQSADSIRADLAAIRDLQRSPGWHLLKRVIEKDIVAACMSMADTVLMTEKEIDFRRGAIFASRSLLTIDVVLASKLESDLLLASNDLDASNRNATA